MHGMLGRLVRVIVLIAVVAAAAVGVWYYLDQQAQPDDRLTASGTIEAVTVTLGPELPGRVQEILVEEGDAVIAGAELVRLDASTLDAPRAPAEHPAPPR